MQTDASSFILCVPTRAGASVGRGDAGRRWATGLGDGSFSLRRHVEAIKCDSAPDIKRRLASSNEAAAVANGPVEERR